MTTLPPAGPAPARLQRCLPQPLGWRRTPTSRRTSTTSRPGHGTCRRSHTTPSTKPADPLCCPVAVRAECRWSFRGVVCHTTPFVAFCVPFRGVPCVCGVPSGSSTQSTPPAPQQPSAPRWRPWMAVGRPQPCQFPLCQQSPSILSP